MKRSAASSSSAVVAPGRTLEASIRMQREWTAPAAAIFSSWSGVLRMIIRYTLGDVLFELEGREQSANPLADLVRRHLPVDPAQQTGVLVVGDERLGLLRVLVESVADHLGLVVVTDDQLAAVDVADALLGGRVELDVEDVAVLDAGAAAAQPPHDLLLGDVDQQHRGQ